MFEEVTYQRVHGSVDIQRTLLARYKRDQTYFGILKRPTISKDMKLLLRKPDTKQMILEAIEKDIRDPIKPEGVYEIWNKEHHSVYRSHESNKEPAKYDEEYFKNILQNEEALGTWKPKRRYRMDLKMINVNERLKLLNGTLRLKSHIAYLSQINGNECLPDDSRVGFHQYHINNLTFFLHQYIMNSNWDLSYKIFSILIRMKGANLRELWPLGIEILRGKQSTTDPTFKSKEQQFLNWLVSYFIIGHYKVEQVYSDPVFKHGTHDHAPMYVIEYYWTLFEEKKFDQVKEGLSNLLIENPYNKEGVLSYMLALCHLFENIQLVNDYQNTRETINAIEDIITDERATIFEKINNNFDELEKRLAICDSLGYAYPKSAIDQQTKIVWDKIKEIDEQFDADEQSLNQSYIIDDYFSEEDTNQLELEDQSKADPIDNYITSPFDDRERNNNAGNSSDKVMENELLQDEEEIPDQYEAEDAPNQNEEEIPDQYEEEEIPDQYEEEEEIPDQYEEEEEIPDQYEEEEEIPDQYEDEEEIPDQYEAEDAPNQNEEEIPDQYEEEEIPDQYEEEEIPDQYEEEEIPDQYEEEEIPDQYDKEAVREDTDNNTIHLEDETYYDAHETFTNNLQSKTEVTASSPVQEEMIKKNGTMEFDFEFF